MSNITRFNPFSRSLAGFDPFFDMDDIVNGFMLRPVLNRANAIEPQIKMDVKAADGKYLVNAEIPGVKKEDIQITVDGNRVSISAEVRQEKGGKEGERVIRSERSYGVSSRSFTFADEIDQSQVQAKYNNGVLELTLPKKQGSSSKQIAIS